MRSRCAHSGSSRSSMVGWCSARHEQCLRVNVVLARVLTAVWHGRAHGCSQHYCAIGSCTASASDSTSDTVNKSKNESENKLGSIGHPRALLRPCRHRPPPHLRLQRIRPILMPPQERASPRSNRPWQLWATLCRARNTRGFATSASRLCAGAAAQAVPWPAQPQVLVSQV